MRTRSLGFGVIMGSCAHHSNGFYANFHFEKTRITPRSRIRLTPANVFSSFKFLSYSLVIGFTLELTMVRPTTTSFSYNRGDQDLLVFASDSS
ncbi:hypothetical protein PM082_024511 [Marasmius tenuissimus]|nr:hypothetical protein PM082_024511 [Marasmius tenuissimus]